MQTITDFFDRTLQEEYFNRVSEAFSYLEFDEICELTEGFREEVDVTFGSSGYTVNLSKPFTKDTSSIFLRGYCTIFAHTYAELRERKNFLLISDKRVADGWSGHVLTESDQESRWFDFNGLNRVEELYEEYSPEFYAYEVVDIEAFRDRCFKGEYSENPYYGLDDFEITFTKYVVHELNSKI